MFNALQKVFMQFLQNCSFEIVICTDIAAHENISAIIFAILFLHSYRGLPRRLIPYDAGENEPGWKIYNLIGCHQVVVRFCRTTLIIFLITYCSMGLCRTNWRYDYCWHDLRKLWLILKICRKHEHQKLSNFLRIFAVNQELSRE